MWADIQQYAIELWANDRVRAVMIVLLSLVLAYIVSFVFRRTFVALADKTANDLDDRLVAIIERPIFWSVVFIGISQALALHNLPLEEALNSVIKTIAVVIWTSTAMRVAEAVLQSIASRARPGSLVQKGTLPAFSMVGKIVIISGAFYAIFLSWDIDVTAWLASAGIIGLAIGFAAQDTLANVITGIMILADGPYKIGDTIVLEKDQVLRGQVTKIGLRSTRSLTRNNVEITVPNHEIGKSKIINEVGGPNTKQRVRTLVSAAYGSDIDHVLGVLSTCADGMDDVCKHPPPEVQFLTFGASGLDFAVFVWIERPLMRDEILSDLNGRIYKKLNQSDIEIPYSKHDLYIKEMPGADGSQKGE